MRLFSKTKKQRASQDNEWALLNAFLLSSNKRKFTTNGNIHPEAPQSTPLNLSFDYNWGHRAFGWAEPGASHRHRNLHGFAQGRLLSCSPPPSGNCTAWNVRPPRSPRREKRGEDAGRSPYQQQAADRKWRTLPPLLLVRTWSPGPASCKVAGKDPLPSLGSGVRLLTHHHVPPVAAQDVRRGNWEVWWDWVGVCPPALSAGQEACLKMRQEILGLPRFGCSFFLLSTW